MASNPGRYKFDMDTGVCLHVDDRSIAERYPTYCAHVGNRKPVEVLGYYSYEEMKGLQCYGEYKRIFRYHEYLRKELSK